jgi:hypothetical protein
VARGAQRAAVQIIAVGTLPFLQRAFGTFVSNYLNLLPGVAAALVTAVGIHRL